MTQFVRGGFAEFINADHIVSLRIQQGSLRNGTHKDDYSYPHYLVAVTSTGVTHELGYWETQDEAWAKRNELIEKLGNGEKVLAVSLAEDLYSGSIFEHLEATAEAIEGWLRAVEGRLNP